MPLLQHLLSFLRCPHADSPSKPTLPTIPLRRPFPRGPSITINGTSPQNWDSWFRRSKKTCTKKCRKSLINMWGIRCIFTIPSIPLCLRTKIPFINPPLSHRRKGGGSTKKGFTSRWTLSPQFWGRFWSKSDLKKGLDEEEAASSSFFVKRETDFILTLITLNFLLFRTRVDFVSETKFYD